MPKHKKLELLLHDMETLKSADWNDLRKIQMDYPFSNLVNMVLAKKQYLETGDLTNGNFSSAILQYNNTGIALHNMVEWKKQKKTLSNKKETAEVANQSSLRTRKSQKTKPEKVESNIPELKLTDEKKSKIKEDPILKKGGKQLSEFTKWLLTKNESLQTEVESTVLPKETESNQVDDLGTNLKEAIISESLAEIYVKQGLKSEAIKMYEKLSLKNPKKSTYFAEIIENLKKK